MSTNDVAVIIPSFNRLEFLKRALESVRAQTCPPAEIVVIDDGSTDGTWEWLQNQKSLTCFRRENGGPAAARNFGVSQVRAPWVAFLDSDDRWLPEKLERQREFLLQNPDAKICQTEEVWIRKGIRVNPGLRHRKPNGEAFFTCLPLCVVSPSAVMIKREFFCELGGFDESFPACEDYELWLRVSLQVPIHTLPQALTVKYGGHKDQLSKKFWGMDRFRVRALEKTLLEQNLSKAQKAGLVDELLRKLNVLSLGHQKRHPDETDPYGEKILWLKKEFPNDRTAGVRSKSVR